MISRIPPVLKRFFALLKFVARRFQQDRCLRVAASLAFTTLLALVPLIAVGFSIMASFPVFEEWGQRLEDFIYKNFIPSAGDIIRQNIQEFSAQVSKLTAVGIVFSIISVLFLLGTVEDAFNDIWRLPKGRGIVQRILSYWAVITLGPLLIGFSFSVTSYLVASTEALALSGLNSMLVSMIPVAFELLAFVLLYVAVPNRSIAVMHALIGGGVAAVLFEIAKVSFANFVASFSTYEVIYGALAVLPIFLLWIFVSWIVVLVGAEIVAALPNWLNPSENAEGDD